MKFLLNPFRGCRKQQAATKPRAGHPARPVPRTAQAGVSNVATRSADLNDPELTPLHQAELEASVRIALPRTSPARAAPPSLSAALRRLLQPCGYRCAVTIVVLAIAGLLAGMAWRNTGERLVASNETWVIDWKLPDGSTWHGAWKTGLPAVAMHSLHGTVVLRYWVAGRGYVTTEGDQDWLLEHSFGYVVAPTGATGAVNPAKRGSL